MQMLQVSEMFQASKTCRSLMQPYSSMKPDPVSSPGLILAVTKDHPFSVLKKKKRNYVQGVKKKKCIKIGLKVGEKKHI